MRELEGGRFFIARADEITFTTHLVAQSQVLREFTRRMQASIRPYDAIGRYGGEEFLIVLPGCDDVCTAAQAERMRSALDRLPMDINDEERVVTCSFGATSWQPGMEPDPEALIRIADDALYIAKNQGRNRVVQQAMLVGKAG